MNPNLTAALAYTQRNWPVFPCHHPTLTSTCSCGNPDCTSIGKHPRIRGGFHAATLDPAAIGAWWTKWPQANIAIPTGRVSGLLVIDIDPRHGGDRSFDRLIAAHGAMPATRAVRTPSGGLHLYYQHPQQLTPNTAGRLGPGIDTRGDGGYIIAPPSRGPGRVSYVLTHPNPIAPAPTWLVERTQTQRNHETPGRTQEQTAEQQIGRRGVSGGRWASQALEDETRRVATAPQGRRNDTLNRSAYNLGQLAAAGHLHPNDIRQRLSQAATTTGLALPEIQTTLESGLAAGLRNPRGPSQRRHRQPSERSIRP